MLNLFHQNKYSQTYFNIINKAKHRILYQYVESHHIIPKCLNGSNKDENLVFLTAKEHFICHLLLINMVKNKKHKYQMVSALQRMCFQSHTHQRCTSRNFDKWKTLISKERSDAYTGEGNPFFRKNHSEETKIKMSINNGSHRIEVREKQSLAKLGKPSPLRGRTLSKETKEKISISVKGFKHTDNAREKMSNRFKNDNIIWIKRNTETKMIAKNELETFLAEGWVKGRIIGHNRPPKWKIVDNNGNETLVFSLTEFCKLSGAARSSLKRGFKSKCFMAFKL